MTAPSPNLRNGLIALALALSIGAIGCEKLGLGDDDIPTGPSPPAPGTPIVYAAIGASDVTGFGSSVVCVPYTDCPNGTGYVFVAARELKSRGYSVTVTNHGIPTAVISRAFQDLGRQYGRLIAGNLTENAMPFVASPSTLVTISAGVNEVNVITAALGGGAGASDPAAFIDQQARNFGNDLTTLVVGIRALARAARIIVLNVPNVAGLPFLANATLAQRQAAQHASVRMTTAVNAIPQIVVVDLMCDPRMYETSNYSSDGLHPNDAGYAVVGAELARAVTASSYPTPPNSCSQMSIVP